MSVDFHRHCQATVLSANGTDEENGLSWTYINKLKDSLSNLPENWINLFKQNTICITQDFASILKILNQSISDINSQITTINNSSVKKININNTDKKPDSNGKVSLGSYLSLSGGTMNGNLTLKADPTQNLHAATKQYVDNGTVHKTGTETITGNKTFNGTTILKGGTFTTLTESPPDTADGHEVVDAAWVRQVIQVDDSTVVREYVSASGNDDNDGKTLSTPKKTMDAALAVLNSYRLSSPTGLAITMNILGDYDIELHNTTKNSPIIAHPDAVNQNRFTISGSQATYDSNGRIQLSSSLKTTKDLQNGAWYQFISPSVSNLNISSLNLKGFKDKGNVTNSVLVCMTPGMVRNYFSNVQISNGFTNIFSVQTIPGSLEFANYVALSSMILEYKIPRVLMWSSIGSRIDITERDPHSNETLTELNNLKRNEIPTLILKNISRCDWDIDFTFTTPYINTACRCDIVLDNVTCQISTSSLGFKKSFSNGANGTEYYFNIHCLNGTDISSVFPNVNTTNGYNKVFIYGLNSEFPESNRNSHYEYILADTQSELEAKYPKWYDKNWDVV